MSHWTYVSAVLEVHTFPFVKFSDIDEVSDKLKLICSLHPLTGSEDIATIYVNTPKSSNISQYEHGEWSELCDYVYLIIVGALCDRKIEETIEEFIKFIDALEKEHFYVHTFTSVGIIKDGEESVDIIKLLEDRENEREKKS